MVGGSSGEGGEYLFRLLLSWACLKPLPAFPGAWDGVFQVVYRADMDWIAVMCFQLGRGIRQNARLLGMVRSQSRPIQWPS
jgi:hypothetical protein